MNGSGRARFEDLQQGKFYDIDEKRISEDRSISYGQVHPDRSGDWWGSDYTVGSDYSGGTVTLSNYRVITEMAEELAAEHGSEFYVCAYGGHGTYAIFFNVETTPDEIVEVLEGLDGYALIDESAHSELEIEQQEEAWESWAKRDFARELEKKFGGSADDMTDEQLWQAFHDAAEETSTYWEDQEGSGMWIDMKRILKAINEPPDGFVED